MPSSQPCGFLDPLWLTLETVALFSKALHQVTLRPGRSALSSQQIRQRIGVPRVVLGPIGIPGRDPIEGYLSGRAHLLPPTFDVSHVPNQPSSQLGDRGGKPGLRSKLVNSLPADPQSFSYLVNAGQFLHVPDSRRD